MIRRTLAGLLAAAVLVLAPTAAMAYNLDEYEASVSTTNPAAGEPFTVTVTAPAGTDVTLTIAGPDGYGDVLNETAVNGPAVFTLTLDDEGSYTITATAEDGTVIETLTVVVGDAAAGGGAAAGGDDDAAAGGLPETGATATPLIIGGIALLLVGGAMVYLVRRRSAQA